jgi:hypothetical protein
MAGHVDEQGQAALDEFRFDPVPLDQEGGRAPGPAWRRGRLCSRRW